MVVMENSTSDDESKRRLSSLFYSVSGTVCDSVILYFLFFLSNGPRSPDSVLMTALSVGLLFPCVAGIVASLWWEHKEIFVYAWVMYGLLIFAGSIYYISLLSSLDIWGPLFILIGIIVIYYPIRHLREAKLD